MTKDDWWFHHYNGVSPSGPFNDSPPNDGSSAMTSHLTTEISWSCELPAVTSLDMPLMHRCRTANGTFTVELAVNRAFTTLSFGGSNTGVFGDGQNYTDGLGGVDCISQLNSESIARPQSCNNRIWHPQYTRRMKAWRPGQRLPYHIRFRHPLLIVPP
jgi:hypothetical protein